MLTPVYARVLEYKALVEALLERNEEEVHLWGGAPERHEEPLHLCRPRPRASYLLPWRRWWRRQEVATRRGGKEAAASRASYLCLQPRHYCLF